MFEGCSPNFNIRTENLKQNVNRGTDCEPTNTVKLNRKEGNCQDLPLHEQAELLGGRLDMDTDDWKYIQLLAKKTGEMIGRVVAYNDQSLTNTIFVDDLWVDNSIRNKGVASFLMNALEQSASQHGINEIRLFASGQSDLVSFYTKLGYSRETQASTIMIKHLNSTPSQD